MIPGTRAFYTGGQLPWTVIEHAESAGSSRSSHRIRQRGGFAENKIPASTIETDERKPTASEGGEQPGRPYEFVKQAPKFTSRVKRIAGACALQR
jgi:hypothetical protein